MTNDLPQNQRPLYCDDEVDLLDILIIFARNKFFIFGTALLLALGAAGATFFMTPVYKVNSSFMVVTTESNPDPSTLLAIEVAESASLLERLALDLDLQKKFQSPSLSGVVAALNGSISLTSSKGSPKVTLVVETTNPLLGAEIANSLPDEIQKQIKVVHLEQQRLLNSEKEAIELEVYNLQKKIAKAELDLSSLTAQFTDGDPGEGVSDLRKISPAAEISYINAYAMAGAQRTLFGPLMDRYRWVLKQEKAEAISLQVIEKAVAPQKPVKPRKTLIVVMASFLGGFIGIFGAFIREFFRNAKADPARREKLDELSRAMKLFGGRKE